MKQYKIFCLALLIIFGCFLCLSGCSEDTLEDCKASEPDIPVKLALKNTPGQSGTYRVKTMSQRKISIEGPAKENPLSNNGSQTTKEVEIVFDSSVKKITKEGNALEEITIRELKYFTEITSSTTLDFDSTKDKDPNNALSALIDHSYTIEVTPSGQVANIFGIGGFLEFIKNTTTNFDVAKGLLAESSIKLRHSIPLPDANDNELLYNDTWNNIVTYDFDQMGTQSFERIYTLNHISSSVAGKLKAGIVMNAVPSMKGISGAGQEDGSPSVPPMADIKQTYTGSMEMDASEGILLKYQEELVNQWLIIPPSSNPDRAPSAFYMTATRKYDIEKVK